MARAPSDWTRTGTVAGYAEYLRKQSNAFAVIVVRRDDAVMAACIGAKAEDLGERVLEDIPELFLDLPAARREKRPATVTRPVIEEWGM